MSLLKRLLKRMMSPQQRAGLKRLKRHLVTFIKRPHKTSIAELENILRYDLGITVGDRVFISSSFGLLNALCNCFVATDCNRQRKYYDAVLSADKCCGMHE